ncbi:PQQ-binding-like beta-propeller repeat protein [Streptosporangium canum]|uniref:outer membrane protein assembly factor BamB family protein n=1 Tax=Streptosporangium canum TaxID=324952 RepID=UPI003677B31C
MEPAGAATSIGHAGRRPAIAWRAIVLAALLTVLSGARPLSPPPFHVPVPFAAPLEAQGRSVEVWQTPVDPETGLFLIGDVAVVEQKRRLTGLDARTGATRWVSSLESPGFMLADDHFILSEKRVETQEETHSLLTVLDARSGVSLWTAVSGFPADGPWRPYFSLIGMTAGHAIVTLPSLRRIRAFDLDDGDVAWETALPGECEALPVLEKSDDDSDVHEAADDQIAVMLMRCGGRTHLLGLASGDGGLRWDRPVTDRDVTGLSLQDGVTALQTPHSLTLVSAGGTVLYDYAAADVCEGNCRVEVLGDAVVVARGGGSDTEIVVEMTDRRTGRLVWTRTFDGSSGYGLQTAGDRLYMEYRLPPPLEHLVLDLLDPATGRTVRTTADPTTDDDGGTVVVDRYGRFFYALSGSDEKPVLTAFRLLPGPGDPGWAARDGVPASAWPDACALLPGGPGIRAGRPAPAGLSLPGSVTCELRPASGPGPVVKVSILWVHPSVEEAKDATTNKGLKEPSGWIASVADAARFLDDTLTDAALIRAGPILVTVEALGDPALTRRSVTAVAENLRTGPWGGGR